MALRGTEWKVCMTTHSGFACLNQRRGNIGKNHAAEFLRRLKLTLLFSLYFHDSLDVHNFDTVDNS